MAPAHGTPADGSRSSPRSIIRSHLQPLTPLVTQGTIPEAVRPPHSRQSSGNYSYRSSPAVETADIPEGLLPSSEDPMISRTYLTLSHLLIPSRSPSPINQ